MPNDATRASVTDIERGRERLGHLWQRGRDLLGSEQAILGGAMSWVSERHLVSAISNAGGFGVIACGAMGPDLLRAEIEATRAMTDRPFGVNLITMHPELEGLIDTCVEQSVSHIVLAGGLPRSAAINRIKDAGIRVLCFAPALALALSTNAPAQEAGPTAAPEAKPDYSAIALVDISQRAEATARVLKQAADALPPDEGVAAIERGIPEFEDALTAKSDALFLTLAGGIDRRRLTDLSVEWSRANDQLQGWKAKINPRLQQIKSTLESLSDEREVWEHTREQADGQDAPESVVERIRTTLSKIELVTATARARRSQLLTLQDAIVQQDLLVTSGLDQIRTTQDQLRSGLLQRDAAPLWRDLRETRSTRQ